MADRTYNKIKIDGVVKLDLSGDTVTADTLLKNTTAHNHLGAAITGTYEPPTFTTQTKSATPTESTQEITPDASYDGLSKVTVGAISSTYVGTGVSRQAAKTVTPNGSTQTAVSSGKYTTGDVKVAAVPTETKSITTNGTHTPTSGKYFSSVTVDVPTSLTLQEKSATPSETAQDIVADTGYDGLSKVSVGAISNTYIGSGVTRKAAATITPSEETQTIAAGQYLNGAQTISAISSTYVGSGVARKSSTDLTASGATVSVPAGYYASNASKSVASGTAGTPSASKGTVSNNSVSVTPTVTNTTGYITGGTKTGTAVTVSASELVSGTKSITTTASIDVTNYKNAQISDANLVSTNIKKDATILGVSGSDKVRDVSDTTATAATVKSGSYFYNSSGIYTGGTMVTQDYYTGTSDPASSLGNNGDLYLKTT